MTTSQPSPFAPRPRSLRALGGILLAAGLLAGCANGGVSFGSDDPPEGDGQPGSAKVPGGEGKGEPGDPVQEHPTLGMHDLLAVAKSAGLACDRLAVAAAVAMAESGGDPTAVTPAEPTSKCPDGSRDLGLWQLNDCYYPMAEDCAFDPVCNAQEMVDVSEGGTTWAVWASYVDGTYEQFLGAAEQAYAEGVPGCPIGGGTGEDPPEPEGSTATCDDLGYIGACVGQVSVWAEDGTCKVRDCASEGKHCDWISDDIGWGCMEGTQGATTMECGEFGYVGACLGETLVWAQDGLCNAVYCPQYGYGCGWDAGTGYNCI